MQSCGEPHKVTTLNINNQRSHLRLTDRCGHVLLHSKDRRFSLDAWCSRCGKVSATISQGFALLRSLAKIPRTVVRDDVTIVQSAILNSVLQHPTSAICQCRSSAQRKDFFFKTKVQRPALFLSLSVTDVNTVYLARTLTCSAPSPVHQDQRQRWG